MPQFRLRQFTQACHVGAHGFGIRAVTAPSLADIFQANAVKNGLLPVVLPEATVVALAERASAWDGLFTADLVRCVVAPTGGEPIGFEIAPAQCEILLKGRDEIGLALRLQSAIAAFPECDRHYRP